MQKSRTIGNYGIYCNGGKLYRSDQGILDGRSRIIIIFWSCGILCPGSISYIYAPHECGVNLYTRPIALEQQISTVTI